MKGDELQCKTPAMLDCDCRECKPVQKPDLRDWFAAQALPVHIGEGATPAEAAEHAYEYADAMMIARVKH